MRLLCLAALLAAASSSAAQSAGGAQDPDPDEQRAVEPPLFYETTTVTARPVSSATGAVSVLDARELRLSCARSAADALAAVPGLNPLATGGRAGVTNAFLRGADPNYTLVLLDGIPLNDATELQGGAVNLEELPIGLVDRVEVVRGPLASFYGTSALAGVVQLFTHRGAPGPLRGRAELEGGNAELRRLSVRGSGSRGPAGFAAGASWERERHRVADDRFRQLDTWATSDLRLASAVSLALTARFSDGRTDDYPDASGGPVHGTGLLRQTDHRDLALGARLELGGESGRRQRILLGFARRRQERTSPAVPPVVPESEERTTYRRLRFGWQVPLAGSARTQLDAGLSGEGEWGVNESVLRLPPEMGGELPGDYVERRFTAGAFSGLTHERGRFVSEAALRLDLPQGGSLQINPHAGLAWRASDDTRLRASVGRASKMPSFFALASPRALGGNPALEPEHVWGAELGFVHALPSLRLELEATGFRQRYSDLIDFDFDRFLHLNRARVRTQGLELRLRLRPHATLWLEGEATRLDVDDLDSGGTLLHVPRWTGGGRLTWESSQDLSLRLSLRASEGYLDRQYPVPERDSLEGYGLLAFAGFWRVRGGLHLRARADNLTDHRYETLVGFPGPRRSLALAIGWERP